VSHLSRADDSFSSSPAWTEKLLASGGREISRNDRFEFQKKKKKE